ncbi:MAG: phosphoribosylformylglycinamidine synthase subunit PurS [Bacteroidota bacterium]|nr:phosphoribosylformylglycinamidine synthase subunit PurS [Bacteroidota bacterium]
MLFLAKITITLKKSILDPQGKAVYHALESLNFSSIQDVRIGKYIEMKINSNNMEEAKRQTEDACQKLLSNVIMENYSFTIEEIN